MTGDQEASSRASAIDRLDRLRLELAVDVGNGLNEEVEVHGWDGVTLMSSHEQS